MGDGSHMLRTTTEGFAVCQWECVRLFLCLVVAAF